MTKLSMHPAVAALSRMGRHRLHLLDFDPVKDGWKVPNLGEPLGRISSSALTRCRERVTNATGFQLVCSYNWRTRRHTPRSKKYSRSQPEIAVPGVAPTFLPFELPRAVGHGTTPPPGSRDANLAKLPNGPYNAMFCAMSAMSPSISLDDVDIIVTRGALTRLLRIAQDKREPMRQDLHMVNNTLVIFRQWERLWEQRAGRNVGRTFEHIFARHSSDAGDLRSHHRAILYNLGPLRCLVLLEVDATVMIPKRRHRPKGWTFNGFASPRRQISTTPTRHQGLKAWTSKMSASRRRQVLMTSKRYPEGRTSKQSASRACQTLVSSKRSRRPKGWTSMRLPNPKRRSLIDSHQSEGRQQSRAERAIFRSLHATAHQFPSSSDNIPVKMVYKGIGTLSSLTSELVTNHTRRRDAVKRDNRASRKYPQMWFGRTPFLIRGKYSMEQRKFTKGFILDATKQMTRFERVNQKSLQKLVAVLQQLRVLTQETTYKQAVAVSTANVLELQVFRTRYKAKLPISKCWLRQFWTRKPEHACMPLKCQESPRSTPENRLSALGEES